MTEIVYPVERGKSGVSSRYDELRGGVRHKGIDIASTPMGSTPDLAAVVTGQVVLTGFEDRGAGNWLWLHGDDGTRWKYFHLTTYIVRSGAVVAGQPIAVMGTTGHSTGVHLHLEKHAGGWSNPIDPTPDLDAAIAAGRFPGASTVRAISSSFSSPADVRAPVADTPSDQFVFPDGTTYAMAATPESDTGFAWVHIGSPTAQRDGLDERLLAPTVRHLANGSDRDDALFERHPVLSGPHVRATHT